MSSRSPRYQVLVESESSNNYMNGSEAINRENMIYLRELLKDDVTYEPFRLLYLVANNKSTTCERL